MAFLGSLPETLGTKEQQSVSYIVSGNCIPGKLTKNCGRKSAGFTWYSLFCTRSSRLWSRTLSRDLPAWHCSRNTWGKNRASTDRAPSTPSCFWLAGCTGHRQKPHWLACTWRQLRWHLFLRLSRCCSLKRNKVKKYKWFLVLGGTGFICASAFDMNYDESCGEKSCLWDGTSYTWSIKHTYLLMCVSFVCVCVWFCFVVITGLTYRKGGLLSL